MKRITPEEVVEAYRRFPQVQPASMVWRGAGCGCPAFVMAVAADRSILDIDNNDDAARVAANAMTARYGGRYMDCFTQGVDHGVYLPEYLKCHSAEEIAARADGAAAWSAVLAAGLGGATP